MEQVCFVAVFLWLVLLLKEQHVVPLCINPEPLLMEFCTFMTSPNVLKSIDLDNCWVPSGVSELLEIWYEGLCQILILGDALGPSYGYLFVSRWPSVF